MKYSIFIISVLLFLSTNLYSQEDNWFTDKADAIAYSEENEVPILMTFGGSDWCRPCMIFKKDVLDSPEFKAFSESNVAILYLDFPAKKKNQLSEEQRLHNEALAEQYNQSGSFPKIILMDSNFEKLSEIEYKKQTAPAFIEQLNREI